MAMASGFEATPEQWRRALNQLIADGEIVAEGATRSRRYALA
jgi:hypothetical protein